MEQWEELCKTTVNQDNFYQDTRQVCNNQRGSWEKVKWKANDKTSHKSHFLDHKPPTIKKGDNVQLLGRSGHRKVFDQWIEILHCLRLHSHYVLLSPMIGSNRVCTESENHPQGSVCAMRSSSQSIYFIRHYMNDTDRMLMYNRITLDINSWPSMSSLKYHLIAWGPQNVPPIITHFWKTVGHICFLSLRSCASQAKYFKE